MSNLESVLATLSASARRRGLTDTAWAASAGVRKETLSRLRSRRSCDFATLDALARAVGARVDVLDIDGPPLAADGHFPVAVKRDDEERLLALAASRTLDANAWKRCGPAFFMAGLAVMLAGVRGLDRPGLLALAERLHPGSSAVDGFTLWLARSPVRPSRFIPMLKERLPRAA
jgi:hypothetical protein